jgi:hypothetical protein
VQNVSSKPDAGRRVSLSRFRQDLLLRNLRQLSNDLLTEIVVREHPDTLRRKNSAEPIEGLLNKGTFPEETQDLLRSRTTAPGPKTRTATPGQDQAVIVLFRHIQQFIVATFVSLSPVNKRITAEKLKHSLPSRFCEEVQGNIREMVKVDVAIG